MASGRRTHCPAKPTTPSRPAQAYVDWGQVVDSLCTCGAPSVAEVGEDYLCPICEDWHTVEFPMPQEQ